VSLLVAIRMVGVGARTGARRTERTAADEAAGRRDRRLGVSLERRAGSSLRSDGQVFLSTVKEQNGVVHSDPTLHMKIEQNPQQPLPVTLGVTPQHPLPVGINTIKAGAEWEPIRTKSEPAQAPRVDSK